MSIKRKKYRKGDLVTREYDYRADYTPDDPKYLPLGIILEDTSHTWNRVKVWWIVDCNERKNTTRLSNLKRLRLVNRA